jgi:hypothetical protein
MNRPAAFIGSPHYQAGLTLSEGFNRKADIVMAGSVFSGVQSSNHIRARQQLECNGYTRVPGYLQEFDLKTFCHKTQEMAAVRRYIEASPFFETASGIAYRFFHYAGDTRTVHGVIVTGDNGKLLRRFDREDLGLGRSEKSASVLDFCQSFVCVQTQSIMCETC